MEEWLEVRTHLPGALICPATLAGQVELRHFVDNGNGIYKPIQKRAEICGIERFSPHDFRRTFCTELLDKGEDVLTVRDLAGHSSMEKLTYCPSGKGIVLAGKKHCRRRRCCKYLAKAIIFRDESRSS